MKRPRENQSILYTYWYWDEELQQNIPTTITSGQDCVTEELIIQLKEFDHEESLSDRYERENRDFTTENKKNQFSESPEDSAGDPIENLGTYKTDPAYLLDHDPNDSSPIVEQLLQLIPELEPQQVDLIYDYYGARRQLTEIAREQGVSVTAISNRIKKIHTRIKKLFAQKGIL